MQKRYDCCLDPQVFDDVCITCGYNHSKTQEDESASGIQNEPKMPPLIKQAANFAKATVKHVANMGRNTPDMVMKSRLEICNNCDKNNDGRCSECGCFVDVKTSWASEACPLGHWLEYKDTPGKCGGCGRK